MKHKLFSIFLLLCFLFFLSACNYDLDLPNHRVFMLTNYGTVDDQAFNQNVWEGIEKFGKQRDVYYTFISSDVNTENVMDSIDYAVDHGATIIVAPGYQYRNVIYHAQNRYQNIYFIIVDAEPVDDDGVITYQDHTSSILFAEEQSGFLTGYMAALEPFNRYAFIGGMPTDAVNRFGIGFVYGIFYSIYENNLSLINDLNIDYAYLNGFDEHSINHETANTVIGQSDIIFTASGQANYYVFDQVIKQNKKVIGSDVNQGIYHQSIMNSALKKLDVAVDQELTRIFRQTFEHGVRIKTIKDSALGLVTDKSYYRFSADISIYYNFEKNMKNNPIKVPKTKEELKLQLELLDINFQYETIISKIK